MRPSEESANAELYECYSCGVRVESPDSRSCDSCGGTLRNIARSRDM